MARILSGTIRLGRAIGSFGAKLWALGNAVKTDFGETFGNDAGDDVLPWTNALPIQLDKYGNAFTILTRWNASNRRATFAWRNVGGAWTDNPILSLNDGNAGELALDQGMIAYDSTNDIAHVLWVGTTTDVGILYRRYVFTRDGSHNITAIDWDYTDGTNTTTKLNTRTNLQLDINAQSYVTMQLFLLTDAAYGQYGALLAVWNAQSAAGSEMRASMCVFGATAQRGKTAANWTNIGLGLAGSAFGTTVSVAYDALVSRSGISASILPVIARKQAGTHAKDIYLAYADQITGVKQWRYTRLVWASGSNTWTSQTTPVTICNVVRSGTDTGYSLKEQLMSAWAEDTANDRMYIGISTWKDNTLGDTASFVKVDSADATTIVDVASAGGAWFFAPAASVAFDSTKGLLVFAYPRATDGNLIVQLYKDTTAQGSSIVVPVTIDVAELAAGATVGGVFGGKVVVYGRTATAPPAPPYTGYYVTLDWQ